MVNVIIKIWEFTLDVSLDWLYTKWYYPLDIKWGRGFKHGQVVFDILWVLHIEVWFPMKSSAKEARKYLPNR